MPSCSTRKPTSTFNPLDKIKTQVRMAYKILRPSGRDYGIAAVSFNPHTQNHRPARLVHSGTGQRL